MPRARYALNRAIVIHVCNPRILILSFLSFPLLFASVANVHPEVKYDC